MIVLLDTNALYWWLNDPSRLSAAAEAAIVNRSNSVVVSAVVPWELAIKTNLGKLRAETLLSIWDTKLADEGFSELPISSAHGIRAGLLRRHHRDPFDRMLIAQSLEEKLPLVSADPLIARYPVEVIW